MLDNGWTCRNDQEISNPGLRNSIGVDSESLSPWEIIGYIVIEATSDRLETELLKQSLLRG